MSRHSEIFTAIRAMPGLEVDRVQIVGTTFEARVLGRGPSLHRTGMRWEGDLTDGVEVALAPYMELQRSREAVASALGFDPGTPALLCELSHLVVDRLLLRHSPMATVDDIAGTVRKLTQLSVPGLQKALLTAGVVISDSDDAADPRPRVTLDQSVTCGSYDGRALTISIPDVLPDTILNAAAGRLVREVVDIDLPDPLGPFADRRVTRLVQHVWTERTTVIVYTDADWVPLTD